MMTYVTSKAFANKSWLWWTWSVLFFLFWQSWLWWTWSVWFFLFWLISEFRIQTCLLFKRNICENFTLNTSLNKEVTLRLFTSTKLNFPHPKCVVKIDSLWSINGNKRSFQNQCNSFVISTLDILWKAAKYEVSTKILSCNMETNNTKPKIFSS